MPYYIHKHEVSQKYGGPEEGGWWFDTGTPVPLRDHNPATYKFFNEGDAFMKARELNAAEKSRRMEDEPYQYTSVLSYMGTFYSYSVHESCVPESYPKVRPHYE